MNVWLHSSPRRQPGVKRFLKRQARRFVAGVRPNISKTFFDYCLSPACSGLDSIKQFLTPSFRWGLRAIVFAVYFLITTAAFAEPTIRQIFPKQSIFLGEFVDWVIEVRHPLWESYELRLMAPRGAEMKIVETNQQSIGNEMRSVYRIRIFPRGLAVEGTPSVLLADGRGRNSVLNGKPLIVRTISGDSTQIKEPLQPLFRKAKSFTNVGIASAIILFLLALLVFLRIQRIRSATPRAQLLRQLGRLKQELQQGEVRNPLLLSRLLRSDLIWGFHAESFTAAELIEKASGKLENIAPALESLDFARYSSESEKVKSKSIEEALIAAIEILKIKRVEQVEDGGKAA